MVHNEPCFYIHLLMKNTPIKIEVFSSYANTTLMECALTESNAYFLF